MRVAYVCAMHIVILYVCISLRIKLRLMLGQKRERELEMSASAKRETLRTEREYSILDNGNTGPE